MTPVSQIKNMMATILPNMMTKAVSMADTRSYLETRASAGIATWPMRGSSLLIREIPKAMNDPFDRSSPVY
jgi:hypothetical protein